MVEGPPPVPPETVSADVDLRIAGARVQLSLTVPTASAPPGVLLPVFQSLSAALEADVASSLEGQGKRISCRAGCGACCRQLVPIARVEARRLAELVASFPEPRQSAVRARFAAAIRRLDEAGLLDALRQPEHIPHGQKVSVGLAYFALGIACPFLEEESCSIHENRPLICREFLVTSPPEHCADPAGKRVEGVKLPLHLSNVLARFAEPGAPGLVPRVVLPLALEWAEAHPDDSPTRPGPEWVERLFAMLSGRDLPDAAQGEAGAVAGPYGPGTDRRP